MGGLQRLPYQRRVDLGRSDGKRNTPGEQYEEGDPPEEDWASLHADRRSPEERRERGGLPVVIFGSIKGRFIAGGVDVVNIVLAPGLGVGSVGIAAESPLSFLGHWIGRDFSKIVPGALLNLPRQLDIQENVQFLRISGRAGDLFAGQLIAFAHLPQKIVSVPVPVAMKVVNGGAQDLEILLQLDLFGPLGEIFGKRHRHRRKDRDDDQCNHQLEQRKSGLPIFPLDRSVVLVRVNRQYQRVVSSTDQNRQWTRCDCDYIGSLKNVKRFEGARRLRLRR